MKSKLLNILLIVTSLLGYLEWGGGNQVFLFKAEFDIIRKLLTDPASANHPLIILPMLGQLLLLITLFQKNPLKLLVYSGIICLSLLLGFMFFIGIIGSNYKIACSIIPFIITVIFAVRHYRKN